MQKADLLRRSGQLERLIEEYTGLHMASDIENQILEFQLYCAKRKDRSCYTLDDVKKFAGK